MMNPAVLESFANEQRPQSSRLDVIAEHLSYAIEYLAAGDPCNWSAADLCACSEGAAQDLAELEAVIETAFRPARRSGSPWVGMRYSTVRQ